MALKAVAAPLGSPVGGSGTLNYVAKWTGGSTLGDSIIAQNAGSTGIAIGDVAGVSYVGIVQIKKAGGAGWLTLDHTGGSYAEVQSYNVPLYLNRQGNNTILNSTSGNVGIGTASPGYRLHVKDATNRNMIMTSGTTGMKMTSLTDAGAEADVGVQGNTVQLLTSATERMRIDSSGNVYAASGTTGMTNGFFYIPGAAGAPTGTPTAVTGRVPMYYDTTNNKFYVYNGAWKQVTLT